MALLVDRVVSLGPVTLRPADRGHVDLVEDAGAFRPWHAFGIVRTDEVDVPLDRHPVPAGPEDHRCRALGSEVLSFLRPPPCTTKPTTGRPDTGWSSTPALTTDTCAVPSGRYVTATARPASRAPRSRAWSSRDTLTGAGSTRSCCRAYRPSRTRRMSALLLGDVEAVAVVVAEAEHQRRRLPVEELADLEPELGELLVGGTSIRGDEPDARVDAGRKLVAAGDEGERRLGASRRQLHPPEAGRSSVSNRSSNPRLS